MYVKDLSGIKSNDVTYFLRSSVEDSRIVDGHARSERAELAGDSALTREIKQLQPAALNDQRVIVIGGNPVYDNTTGVVRYDMKIVRGKVSSTHPITDYGIQPMLEWQALMARQDILKALLDSDMPAGFIPEIVNLGEGFYTVAVQITPDGVASNSKIKRKLDDIVRKIGNDSNHEID